MSEITGIIQVFYPERAENLAPIVAEIRAAGIERVIVWNNNPSRYVTPLEGVDEIRSSFDTLIGQYAAAFLASTPIIYCQNDDLLVPASTINRMKEHVEDGRFVALSGAILNRQSRRPYADSITKAGDCDVMQGRAWMARKSALVPGIVRSLAGNIYPGVGEDLFFSFGRTYALAEPEFTNFEEGNTGLSRLPGHVEERDRWATRLLAGL